jgi:hypothetical protein
LGILTDAVQIQGTEDTEAAQKQADGNGINEEHHLVVLLPRRETAKKTTAQQADGSKAKFNTIKMEANGVMSNYKWKYLLTSAAK